MELINKIKQTILIVDDSKINLSILIDILKEYDVIPCLSGEDAINIILEDDIDLILLDVVMPGMDGFEVCKILKENPKTAKIPILFLTSKSKIDDIQKGFKLGAIDYITKPFNSFELISRIDTHLELRYYQQNLELKIEKEIEKNRHKERIMFQQSKQAEVGELLMHIAHQWKQPLTRLGSLNMYNIAQVELNSKFDKDELHESFIDSSNIITFMSQTIETFQNFYNPMDKDNFFNIRDAIQTAINIVDATFKYKRINLEFKIKKDMQIYGNKNEYSQVILSILNNAKDIFLMRKIKNPNVVITIDKDDEKSIVTISDNAGGILFKNIDDIFLPFVSDKNGTGNGLYMSKNIIEKNGGVLLVKNNNEGAEFKIIK